MYEIWEINVLWKRQTITNGQPDIFQIISRPESLSHTVLFLRVFMINLSFFALAPVWFWTRGGPRWAGRCFLGFGYSLLNGLSVGAHHCVAGWPESCATGGRSSLPSVRKWSGTKSSPWLDRVPHPYACRITVRIARLAQIWALRSWEL